MIQIVYFARIREDVGVENEQIDVKSGTSILMLIDQLAGQSKCHAAAFSDRTKLRFAVDQKMVRADVLLDGAHELAIFPPVTGG